MALTKLNCRFSVTYSWWLKYIYLPAIEFMLMNDIELNMEKVRYWMSAGIKVKCLGIFTDSGERIGR